MEPSMVVILKGIYEDLFKEKPHLIKNLEDIKNYFDTKNDKLFDRILKEGVFGTTERADNLIQLFTVAKHKKIPIFILTSNENPGLQCKILHMLEFPGIEGCISISPNPLLAEDLTKYEVRTFENEKIKLSNFPICSPQCRSDTAYSIRRTKYNFINTIMEKCLGEPCSVLKNKPHIIDGDERCVDFVAHRKEEEMDKLDHLLNNLNTTRTSDIPWEMRVLLEEHKNTEIARTITTLLAVIQDEEDLQKKNDPTHFTEGCLVCGEDECVCSE